MIGYRVIIIFKNGLGLLKIKIVSLGKDNYKVIFSKRNIVGV